MQVFLNLGRNALQAMTDRDGTLTHHARDLLSSTASIVGDGARVPTVEVDFDDDGRGIPEAVRDRLATPFFTTKARGTGLGLAVARHFVTLHGGTLQIESRSRPGHARAASVPLRARRRAAARSPQ